MTKSNPIQTTFRMKKSILFLVLLLLCNITFHAHSQGSQDTGSQQEFAAIYTYGEKWEAGKPPAEQAYFMAHSTFLFQLKQTGAITAGMKVADKSIILFKAVNIDEAKKIFLADASVTEKTYQLDIQPATIFYKGCL